ncbi:YdeI/OmpD-associated family protein [Mumia sp. Pv 4-285]|uniref:YdeI/OmpD-associated family protein n=1 Tax=Mumia qirimensis TaxID=3234852 RepID=UPI00351CDC6C
MRVTAELEATGGTTTGFRIPEGVVEELGGGRRPKVAVTVNGATIRTTIAKMGDDFWLGLSAARREETGTSAGDVLDLEIELDTAPREVEVPADLATALAADPEATATWEKLSFSNKRWHVEQATGAKKPETRAARVAKSVQMLHEGRAR